MNDHPDASPIKDTIDVECNPNIRRLTVRTEYNHQLPSYLKHLLFRLSAPNIQQVTVLLGSCEAMNWRGWNEVDQVLDGVKFGSLREVAIIVVNTYQGMDIIRQHFTYQFPSMYDRGILNIKAQERER